jgi:hypothetical protein
VDVEQMQREFEAVQERWRQAVAAHRMAPPDAGFAGRLAGLAAACGEEAAVCREAHAAGYSWPPHTATARPPYELLPDSGRRGPEELWREFDYAAYELSRTGAGTDLLAVARAHELLGEAASKLAAAVALEDQAAAREPLALG